MRGVGRFWDAIWPHVLVVHPGNVCNLCALATICRRPKMALVSFDAKHVVYDLNPTHSPRIYLFAELVEVFGYSWVSSASFNITGDPLF